MWEKICYRQTGHKRQYNTAQKIRDLPAGWLRQKYGHTHTAFKTYCFMFD
jgi:hypothetical protein